MDREEFENKVRERSYYENFLNSVHYDISLTKTSHFEERRYRHSTEITEEEIEDTFDEVERRLVRSLLEGEYAEGDEIVIRDHVYNLNIVCKIENKFTNSCEILLETVMLDCDFEPNSGQSVVDIYK